MHVRLSIDGPVWSVWLDKKYSMSADILWPYSYTAQQSVEMKINAECSIGTSIVIKAFMQDLVILVADETTPII